GAVTACTTPLPPSGSSVASAGMPYATQWVNPSTSGASGSWTTTANALVPSGTPDHSSGGATFSPFEVCRSGIDLWPSNAALLILRSATFSFCAMPVSYPAGVTVRRKQPQPGAQPQDVRAAPCEELA